MKQTGPSDDRPTTSIRPSTGDQPPRKSARLRFRGHDRDLQSPRASLWRFQRRCRDGERTRGCQSSRCLLLSLCLASRRRVVPLLARGTQHRSECLSTRAQDIQENGLSSGGGVEKIMKESKAAGELGRRTLRTPAGWPSSSGPWPTCGPARARRAPALAHGTRSPTATLPGATLLTPRLEPRLRAAAR